MKILIKSAWGSDDPTKAAFAFLHANAFAEAGHEVLTRRGCILDEGCGHELGRARWLASAISDNSKNDTAQDPPPHMNGLLAGPCGRPV